jgi:hypothetical protein
MSEGVLRKAAGADERVPTALGPASPAPLPALCHPSDVPGWLVWAAGLLQRAAHFKQAS